MQGLFTYIYHILLIITFVRTIEICSHTYRTTNEAWTNDCRWMFVFLLIESIGSFAFDMGYISDVMFGFGSILTLLKVTIDVIVYAFLCHLIYDYLDLPRDDGPFILLGFMYSIAAMLVLQTCNPFALETDINRRFITEKKGVPYLSIETDFSDNDKGQISTRIGAFIEIIEANK